MKNNIWKMCVAAITIVAIGVFTHTLYYSAFYFHEEEATPETVAQIVETIPVIYPQEKPSRLLIPSIGVDAHVQEVGLTKKGAMGTPTNFTDVGWYKYGVVPGGNGSAVMDGHVDNGLALAGVFKRLHEVKPGEEIIVVDVQGNRLRFVVDEVKSYSYTDAPTEEIFTKNDTQRLNLITCGGNFLKELKTYDTRVVVYTRFISSEPASEIN